MKKAKIELTRVELNQLITSLKFVREFNEDALMFDVDTDFPHLLLEKLEQELEHLKD